MQYIHIYLSIYLSGGVYYGEIKNIRESTCQIHCLLKELFTFRHQTYFQYVYQFQTHQHTQITKMSWNQNVRKPSNAKTPSTTVQYNVSKFRESQSMNITLNCTRIYHIPKKNPIGNTETMETYLHSTQFLTKTWQLYPTPVATWNLWQRGAIQVIHSDDLRHVPGVHCAYPDGWPWTWTNMNLELCMRTKGYAHILQSCNIMYVHLFW